MTYNKVFYKKTTVGQYAEIYNIKFDKANMNIYKKTPIT